MEKTIKFRLFHYYIEEPILGIANTMGLVERQAHFGDTVDIPREDDVVRGERLGAFFSDKEVKAIKTGTYDGPEAEALAARLASPGAAGGFPGVPPLTPAELGASAAGGAPLAGMDAVALHEYIVENKLSAADTIALAGGDVDLAERLLDAEQLDPEKSRKTVVSGLEQITSPVDTGDGGGTAEEPASDEPPKNASKDEWQSYASLKGISFDEDDTRDDIIAKVQAALGEE